MPWKSRADANGADADGAHADGPGRPDANGARGTAAGRPGICVPAVSAMSAQVHAEPGPHDGGEVQHGEQSTNDDNGQTRQRLFLCVGAVALVAFPLVMAVYLRLRRGRQPGRFGRA